MIKKHKALLAYMLVLAVFSTYVVLDTFVITRVYTQAEGSGTEAALQNDPSTGDSGSTQLGDRSENSGDDDAGSTQPGSGSGGTNSGNTAGGSEDSEGESSHTHGPGGSRGDGSGGSHGDSSGGPSHGDGSGAPPSGGPGHGDGSGRPGKPGSGSNSSSAGSSSNSGSSSSSGSNSGSSSNTATASSGFGISAMSTKDSYSDDNISIKLSDYTVSGTDIHVAEVSLDSSGYLKTAFAQGAYGRNVTAATSDIADSVNAILAINGDYYGAQEKGYVIRNGELYRDTSAGREDLVIYKDGSFGIINEDEVTASQLIEDGAVQTMSFGPALVENGKVSVDADDEVGRAMASNPRTAIGIKSDGTYIFMVSDGRTEESEGFSLLQLAEFMKYLGAETAYNLDGGGSSTMVFNGTVVNTPTGGGVGNGSGSERKVSDIVYIGY